MKLIRPYKDDCRHLRLDDAEMGFFARQLEYVKAQVYPVLYTDLSAFTLFPISTEAGPGAKTITYRVRDMVGKAKIIAGYGDDLPMVNATRKEVSSAVRSIGAAYEWDLQDIRSAMMAGVSLQADDAIAAVRAHNQTINDIAWKGDDVAVLPGLGNNSDIPSGAAINGAWGGATGEDIVEDVNEILTSIIEASNGVESANTVVVPPVEYAIMASKRASTSAPTDTTVLGFLRANWPGVDFRSAIELKAWDGSDDAMLAFRRDPTKLTLEIPQGYEELPVQQFNLKFKVPTHSRCGGLIVYYPKSVAIRTGIQGGS